MNFKPSFVILLFLFKLRHLTCEIYFNPSFVTNLLKFKLRCLTLEIYFNPSSEKINMLFIFKDNIFF